MPLPRLCIHLTSSLISPFARRIIFPLHPLLTPSLFMPSTCPITLPLPLWSLIFRVFATVSNLSSHPPTDPVPIFLAYLPSRDSLFPLRPALWLTSSGFLPTRTWFLRRLHALFPADVAGHSLRSGGAPYFTSAGWPDERVQALGHCSSPAFHIYIQSNLVL